jgi:hypothetical protein
MPWIEDVEQGVVDVLVRLGWRCSTCDHGRDRAATLSWTGWPLAVGHGNWCVQHACLTDCMLLGQRVQAGD